MFNYSQNTVSKMYMIAIYILLFVFVFYIFAGLISIYLYIQQDNDIITQQKVADTSITFLDKLISDTYFLAGIKVFNNKKLIIDIMLNEIYYWNYNNPTSKEAKQKAVLIYKYALKYNIDPLLMTAIGIAESNLRRSPPQSCAGAVGMFQIMPATGESLSYDIYILEGNIAAASEFINYLINRYNSIKKAVAHYNGGTNPLYKIANYQETGDYVYNVMNIYNSLQQIRKEEIRNKILKEKVIIFDFQQNIILKNMIER